MDAKPSVRNLNAKIIYNMPMSIEAKSLYYLIA